MAADSIDRLVAQWASERPDLELSPMATVGRLLAVTHALNESLEALARSHGVQVPEADVLFTLRRSGPPYRLAPTTLSESLLVSSGTLTSRLDRLETKGLIERSPHATDRRSIEVALTEAGWQLTEDAVAVHLQNERRLLAGLDASEQAALDDLMRKLLRHLAAEGEAGSPTGGPEESPAGAAASPHDRASESARRLPERRTGPAGRPPDTASDPARRAPQGARGPAGRPPDTASDPAGRAPQGAGPATDA